MSAPARLLALLWALLLAGGCDGGLFGTGDGTDADAGPGPVDAAPPPTDDTGADAGPDAAGETDDDADDGGGASTDGDDGDDGDDGASGEPPAVSLPAPGAGPDVDSGAGDASDGGFVNVQVTHDRGVPLLRGVNLTGAAVRVVARRADGTDADGAIAVAPGTASAAVAVDPTTDALAVVDARSSATLAETGPVALGASTLTTLVAFRAGDGAVRAVPLVTSATAPGGGVANVRAILASASGNAGDRVDGIGLRPAGDNPGGAGIDFAPAAAGSIASDYADALPGDYELVLDGRGTGALVTLEAGSTYSLVPGDGDGATVLTIVDGALDDGAP